MSLGGVARGSLTSLDQKLSWFTLCTHCHFAQTGVAFFENEWIAARFQRFRIALEHGRRSVAGIEGQRVLPFREDGARDQPNEIEPHRASGQLHQNH